MHLNDLPDLDRPVGLGSGSSHVDTDVIAPVVIVTAPEILVMATIGIVAIAG